MKGKCIKHLGNRPLSLLNVDAKIYSKILANRLYLTLPSLIHNDQSGFLKGRYIGENLLDLTSIIEHSDEEQIEAILVALDFGKAFDTVNWRSFYEILRFFNFGERYIEMVSKLFENIYSSTINNGYSLDWIKLERGLRQGDCYSPLVFLLIVEILGLKVRQNERIQGISIGHTQKSMRNLQMTFGLP